MGIQEWLQSQSNWHEHSGLWLVGSVLTYVLVSNLSGLARWYLPSRRPGTMSVLQQPVATWVLSEIDWVQSMGMGGALAAGALALLSLGWWSYRRSLPVELERPQLVPRSLLLRWLVALIETFALQVHWGFYRTVVADQVERSTAQWAGWAGMGLIALEWVLNPLIRRSLRRPPHSEPVIRRAVLAIVTTALFILTRNLWLCWALHVLFEGLAQLQDGTEAQS